MFRLFKRAVAGDLVPAIHFKKQQYEAVSYLN